MSSGPNSQLASNPLANNLGVTGTLLRIIRTSDGYAHIVTTTGVWLLQGKGSIAQIFAGNVTGEAGILKTSQGVYIWFGTPNGMRYINVNMMGSSLHEMILNSPVSSNHLYNNGIAVVATNNGIFQISNPTTPDLLSATGTAIATGDYHNMIFPEAFATPVFYGSSGVVIRDASFVLGAISNINALYAGTNSTGTSIRLFGPTNMYHMTTQNYTVSASELTVTATGSFQYSDGSIILGTGNELLKLIVTGGSAAQNPLIWGWVDVAIELIDSSEVSYAGTPLDQLFLHYEELHKEFARWTREPLSGLTKHANMEPVLFDLSFFINLLNTQSIEMNIYSYTDGEKIEVSGTQSNISSLQFAYTDPDGVITNVITDGVIQVNATEWLSPAFELSDNVDGFVVGMCFLHVDVSELLLWMGHFFDFVDDIKNNPAGVANLVAVLNGLSNRISAFE
jgi:hypothetical protein